MILDNNKSVLLTDMHHIISDGQSISIFVDELCKLYNGEPLIEKTIDYKDFTMWELKNSNSFSFKNSEDYWISQFKDEIPILVKRGVEKKKIKAIGIPIRPQTTNTFNKEKSLKKYKLSGNRLICVFFGGGGNGSTTSLPYIKRLIKNNLNLDIIFIAGKNEKSQERVNKYIEE